VPYDTGEGGLERVGKTPVTVSEGGAWLDGKILHLPTRGRVIISTDLHGNLPDYERVVQAFKDALEESEGDAYMLFTGDLVHGACYGKSRWPEHLGSWYRDQTEELVDAFQELQEEFPGRVFSLIGNHEHSHIGGPHTRKFHKDPSETEFLEECIGPEKTEVYKALFRSFPLMALIGKGMVVTHGAPRVLMAGYDKIKDIEYGGHEDKTIREMIEVPILGELFWCRYAGPLAVRRFLKRVERDGQRNHVVVYGHDPVRKGYLREGAEQLCFSTSFGLKNEKKVYLDVDLSREYRSVRALRYGVDILPLYPELAHKRKRFARTGSGTQKVDERTKRGPIREPIDELATSDLETRKLGPPRHTDLL
jgi:hypothetical protein